LNVMAMLIDAVNDVTALDAAIAINILTPGLGDICNYTDPTNSTILISWNIVAFNSTALSNGLSYVQMIDLPVQMLIDGTPVATVPAGTTAAQLNVSAIDARFVHRLSVRALPPSSGSTAHLTTYPLSLDVFDDSAPLQSGSAVPAMAEILFHLPESVW
jgi:uncharacterized protein YceK